MNNTVTADFPIFIPANVGSKYILMEFIDTDETSKNQPVAGWYVAYYGTWNDAPAVQLEDVLLRSKWAAFAHVGVHLPDGSWCFGKIR